MEKARDVLQNRKEKGFTRHEIGTALQFMQHAALVL